MEMHKHQDSISSLFYHTKQRSTRQRIASDERVKDWGARGWGGIPIVGYTGRLCPKGVGKIAILVYKSVTKSAAKWKKWLPKRSISKGAIFWQK